MCIFLLTSQGSRLYFQLINSGGMSVLWLITEQAVILREELGQIKDFFFKKINCLVKKSRKNALLI